MNDHDLTSQGQEQEGGLPPSPFSILGQLASLSTGTAEARAPSAASRRAEAYRLLLSSSGGTMLLGDIIRARKIHIQTAKQEIRDLVREGILQRVSFTHGKPEMCRYKLIMEGERNADV